MKKLIILLIVFIINSATTTLSGAWTLAEQETSKNTFSVFLANPSLASWQSFEADILAGRYEQNYSVYRHILEYHDARIKRDLPNSMSLKNTSPDKFVKQQSRRTNLALNLIRRKESANLWRLLGKLGNQNFDEDLRWTACEIAARLSPPKFEEIATEIQRLHPDKSLHIKKIRKKWLSRQQNKL